MVNVPHGPHIDMWFLSLIMLFCHLYSPSLSGRLCPFIKKSPQWDLNPWPQSYQDCALPTELWGLICFSNFADAKFLLIFGQEKFFFFLPNYQWTVKDSNLRKLLLSDLQSDPVGHLGNRPFEQLPVRKWIWRFFQTHLLPCNWADNGTWTHDLPLTRRLLCQLSYVGELLMCISRSLLYQTMNRMARTRKSKCSRHKRRPVYHKIQPIWLMYCGNCYLPVNPVICIHWQEKTDWFLCIFQK